jgi:ATP-dependent DNA ligase
LHLNGEDLRGLPLVERKARLKRLLRRKRSRILYVDHIEKGPALVREGVRPRLARDRRETEGLAVPATEKP